MNIGHFASQRHKLGFRGIGIGWMEMELRLAGKHPGATYYEQYRRHRMKSKQLLSYSDYGFLSQ
jgi:hypothetical protein